LFVITHCSPLHIEVGVSGLQCMLLHSHRFIFKMINDDYYGHLCTCVCKGNRFWKAELVCSVFKLSFSKSPG